CPWPESSFGGSQEETKGHFPSPSLNSSLTGCDHSPSFAHIRLQQSRNINGKGKLPGKYYDACPSMRWNDLPHQPLPLENNICYVENGQKPGISVTVEIKVVFHSSDERISNVSQPSGLNS